MAKDWYKIEVPKDKDLVQYTAVLNVKLQDLFDDSHRHDYFTAAPSVRDGQINEVRIVKLSTGTRYLYVKFTDGWYRVALSAA
jgi:hypothetical protein